MGRRTEKRKGERRTKTESNKRKRGDIKVDGVG